MEENQQIAMNPRSKNRAPEHSLGELPQRTWFEAPPELVAPRLLGKVLVRRMGSENGTKFLAGRIVETEAYLGPHNLTPDPAAHSYRGPTPRNSVIFGPAGYAYVYAIYGRYFCMNISCEVAGRAGCVLVRALEPLAGMEAMAVNRGLVGGVRPRELTSGPSRLCMAMGLTRAIHNGLDLLDPDSPLQLQDDGFSVAEVLVTPRIGLNVAVDWPLRFVMPEHSCVSGPRKLIGKRISLR
jgi:DNA-3-methyladenine glycosylase